MLKAEELRRLMPANETTGVQGPLNEEVLNMIMSEAEQSALKDYHGLKFELSTKFELKQTIKTWEYYEASVIVERLKDPALGFTVITEEKPEVSLPVVSLYWGEDKDSQYYLYQSEAIEPNDITLNTLFTIIEKEEQYPYYCPSMYTN